MSLDGVIVPLITPLDEHESLDEESLKVLVEHVISGGVSGIFLLGSSGEGPALSVETRERLVSATIDYVKSRVPILIGAFDVGTRHTIELATRLTRYGGDAIVVTAPYYFSQTQAEITAHILAVARSQSIPTFIYNIPQTVKTIIEPETVAELAEDPKVVAIKDSFGDMGRFQRILAIREQRPDFGVFQGAEDVAALSVICGANGGVWGLANVAPQLCCNLYRAARDGDLDRAWKLQRNMSVLGQLHSRGPWLPCLKTAVSLLGICRPQASAPFSTLPDAAVAAIRRDMQAAGIL